MEVGASQGTGGEEPVIGGQPTPSPTPSPSASPSANPAASPTPTPPDPKKPGVWRSDDKGKTWRIVSNENNRPMYYSQIRIDPKNPETVCVGGLNFSISTNGGKTFKSLQPAIPHSDHHAIWIDPNNGSHIMIGNDGGLDITYDQGATWEYVNTIPAAPPAFVGPATHARARVKVEVRAKAEEPLRPRLAPAQVPAQSRRLLQQRRRLQPLKIPSPHLPQRQRHRALTVLAAWPWDLR